MKLILAIIVAFVFLFVILFNDEISEVRTLRKKQEQCKKKELEKERERLEKINLKNQFKPGDFVTYISEKTYKSYYKVISFEEYKKKNGYCYEKENENYIYCCYGGNDQYTTYVRTTEIRKLSKMEKFLYENGGK